MAWEGLGAVSHCCVPLTEQALALQQAPSQPSKKTVTAFCFVVLRVEIGFSFQCKKLS